MRKIPGFGWACVLGIWASAIAFGVVYNVSVEAEDREDEVRAEFARTADLRPLEYKVLKDRFVVREVRQKMQLIGKPETLAGMSLALRPQQRWANYTREWSLDE